VAVAYLATPLPPVKFASADDGPLPSRRYHFEAELATVRAHSGIRAEQAWIGQGLAEEKRGSEVKEQPPQ